MKTKIIIIGAGQVGSSVAEILSLEGNDVTVIDIHALPLKRLQERYDLRTIEGQGSAPDVLRKAGAEDAELILALTDSDEVNMVTCQVAHSLFKVPTKIARIRALHYLSEKQLFDKKSIPIDVIISPEQIVTQQIMRLIEYPGALQVIDFASGNIRLVGLKAYHGGALVGHKLRELKLHLPTVNTRVAAIYRHGKAIVPTKDTVIEIDDEVFFISSKENIRQVMQELRVVEECQRKVFIAGAGNIGFRLAKELEQNGYQVKLIERNYERALWASGELTDTLVLHGDAADEDILTQENIEDMPFFCGLTNADEANILSAMLARRLGASRTMAIINRAAYVDLIEDSVLDIALSPRDATVSALLSHVRRGDVVAAHSLRRGVSEAIEAVVHGDKKSSRLVGRRLRDIKLPPGATFGAIMRNKELLEWSSETVIEEEDHVIIFLLNKQHISDVEKLFQVSASFF